jgi:hypothetical protein
MLISNLTNYLASNQSSITLSPNYRENIFENSLIPVSEPTSNKNSAAEVSNDSKGVTIHTNMGAVQIDFEDHFAEKPALSVDLNQIPLLLPTEHNVNRLSAFSEKKIKALIDKHNIPEPPATITSDQNGGLVLPDDYAYKKEFELALAEDPITSRAISSTLAVSSLYSQLLERQPLQEELATARNDEDRQRIVNKYGYLFDDDYQEARTVLHFTKDGTMTIGVENAKYLKFLSIDKSTADHWR